MRMLNRGFLMIERRHALALKNVKSQLPRRESERRYHPLSRHCDILTSIETRISMLNMTYAKFIDHGLCCFIPGKVRVKIRYLHQCNTFLFIKKKCRIKTQIFNTLGLIYF
ncbi:hypothetical protein O3G_MSEX000917 [Manduca sexta]|nr:hypothetical protein O3G_MSEX000917 [Manduca sexta]